MKINIAISGAPGMGKSTLAAALFSALKLEQLDYDLITEEYRHLKAEMGKIRSPFERMYIWRQQERQENRSAAADGFITDAPLFYQYVRAKRWAEEPREDLAVRELFRMVMETKDRYQLITMPGDPKEIPYQQDTIRRGGEEEAQKTYHSLLSFLQHFCPEKLLIVNGPVVQRVEQVLARLDSMREPNFSTFSPEQRKAVVDKRFGSIPPEDPELNRLLSSKEARYRIIFPVGNEIQLGDGVELDKLMSSERVKMFQPQQIRIRLLKHI